jgi:phosphatidylserine/phosphatidylglycerophosphate/cardiolipin synthase-like enzyme
MAGDAIIYMTVGSHNQDRRSMMLDGESLVLVSGYESLVGITDFAILLGSTHWINSKEELAEEFGVQQSLLKSILHLIKDLI